MVSKRFQKAEVQAMLYCMRPSKTESQIWAAQAGVYHHMRNAVPAYV